MLVDETNTIRTEMAQLLRSCTQPPKFNGSKGIVICGGGYWYFTNAYVNIRLIRSLGCRLPIELWMFAHECDDKITAICRKLRVSLRVVNADDITNLSEGPQGTRWQWVLKPYAIIHSSFTQVLMLDSDSFPVCDPECLFSSEPYLQHGAVFWPDFGIMEEQRPIWKIMGVPYRQEPEFETGQMVIDKRRNWEPLQLALWMNQRADFFYNIIWGDKDTFRFAWHKYGRAFAMPPFEIQALDYPGGPKGVGVMCQHDFEGGRLFQHRNLAKWNLRGENARIAGYFHEEESREFLEELRQQWDGRVNLQLPDPAEWTADRRIESRKIIKDLCRGEWLLEDARTITSQCCGGGISTPPTRSMFPWKRNQVASDAQPSPVPMPDVPAGMPQNYAAAPSGQASKTSARQGLRCANIQFHPDQSITGGWFVGCYWWGLKPKGNGWELLIYNADNKIGLRLRHTKTGQWGTTFNTEEITGSMLLQRADYCYPALAKTRKPRQTAEARPSRQLTFHVAQHAYGIGDVVTGVYACMGAVRAGHHVVYHTHLAKWLSRVNQPGLTITDETPPEGTPDLSSDYLEQVRYASQKTAWYAQFLSLKKNRGTSVVDIPFEPARPKIDRKIEMDRLDFARYVLVAPFAAWANRDWLSGHWRRLAFLLDQAGYTMVAIGTKSEEERIISTFDRSKAFWAIDHPPEWITDAMLGSAAVLGLDSGMVHVAGLLGVPTICIHSHLPPEFLFSHAPSVHSVTPQTACAFCRWQLDRLYTDACNEMCSALCSIGPERVMEQFRKIARR
jgi:hypothetical protein